MLPRKLGSDDSVTHNLWVWWSQVSWFFAINCNQMDSVLCLRNNLKLITLIARLNALFRSSYLQDRSANLSSNLMFNIFLIPSMMRWKFFRHYLVSSQSARKISGPPNVFVHEFSWQIGILLAIHWVASRNDLFPEKCFSREANFRNKIWSLLRARLIRSSIPDQRCLN